MVNLNTFEQYLISKDIEVVRDLDVEISKKDIDEKLLLEQLKLISEFHKKAMGSTGIIKDRLDSSIGRIVEDYKVNIKKIKRDMDRLKQYGPSNTFEKMLLKKANEYVEIGEKVIKNVYQNGYYDLIKRSMRNKEICLADVDFSNIIKEDKIKVKNIEKCCYDMVEMDCYNLLYKCKKAGLKLDYKELVLMFCNFEGLDNNSYQYIISLLSFPYEFAKQCNKYRLRKKDLTDEQYALKLYKAIIQDDLCLI
ncbi:hypothetical protein [Clostridium lundense]|uniref:hypothetical protein n=1 Tax=Clostridium lundense TaxID=319475 RepID=UPI000489B2C1|nr:hypothetical protein [Clostridium lundense]